MEIELSVYMNDPITNAPMYQESPIKTVILDGTADGNGETEAGRAQFTDLPKYRLKQVTTPSENEGEDPIVTWEPEEIQYYLKETGPEGYETTTVLNGSEVTVSSGLQLSANTTTITNKKKAADPITLIKAWDSNPPPAGANAVLTLYGCPTQTNGSPLLSKSTEIKTVTLDGTPDGNGESEAWKAVFTDLPLVSDDGSTMFYYVKERECTVGYEPVYGEEVNGKKPTYAEVSVDPTTSERSITVLNRRAVVDFTVNKQWKGTNENKWPNEETAKTIVLHLKRHEKNNSTLDNSFAPKLTFQRMVTIDDEGPHSSYTCSINGTGSSGLEVQPEIATDKWGNTYYRLTVKGLSAYSGGDDPKEWVYLATEESVENYRTQYADKYRTDRTDGATTGGYIVNERITATLAVKKTVTGVFANRQKAFPFTVTVKMGGEPVTGTFDCEKRTGVGSVAYDRITLDENGTADVTLSHNQTLRILKLPLNATYTVTEKQEEDSEYAVTATCDTHHATVSGASVTGSLANGESDNEVFFVNNRTTFTPSTGVTLGLSGSLMVLTGALAGFLLLRRRMRRRALREAA